MREADYARTDLACEWGRMGECEREGTRYTEGRWAYGTLRSLRICNERAAERIGRPRGEYVTIECGAIWQLDHEQLDALVEVVARALLRLLHDEMQARADGKTDVLVVGLGNMEITADAIGPRAVRELLVTRHLRDQTPDIFRRMGCCGVSALSPGVLGQTGMEVAEVVLGAVQHCHPHALIVIDALAARSCDRLATTVQLSNTGIIPGAGIGNDRCEINRVTMGVPVIALGIPTVVDSSTLVYDALREAGIEQVDERLRRILENGRRFYVSPKEADLITARTAQMVARAINRALVGVDSLP